MWKSAALLSLCCVAFMGCGGDDDEAVFAYNSASSYPENWESVYVQTKTCAKSSTHGGDYVEVWVSPEAEAAFGDRAIEMPVTAVLLKAQFSDSACTKKSGFTAMNPSAVGTDGAVTWHFQRTEVDGTIGSDGTDNFCSSCHMGYPNGIASTP